MLAEVDSWAAVLSAAEEIVDGVEDGVSELSGEAWAAWVELNYRIGRDTSVHGASSHLLYVGRKPGQ